MSVARQAFEGRCHCGAIGYTFHTAQPPARWNVRACQCSFCRSHGVRTVSDPSGSVTFLITERSKLGRYRFGTRSSEFLVCSDCGVYIGALHTSARGQFATLNVNAIRAALDVPEPVPVSYDGESAEKKQSRREERWTPVAEPV
jgi:hypothetical protein